MPLHEVGYRHWEGQRIPLQRRFFVIAQTGIALAWSNRWLRRLVLLAWLPAAYMAIGFFVLEQGLAHQGDLRIVAGFFTQFPHAESVVKKLASGDTVAARSEAWAWLLLTFFRYPQGVLMVLVVGIIAPPLIAKDVHSQAFLLYFSRPITPLEYATGKLAVIGAYVVLISTLPALMLYGLGILLSPLEADVVRSTWDLPLRIVAASVVLILPTASLALAFSSLTTKTFYAGFAWFAVWVLGFVTFQILRVSVGLPADSGWTVLSLYHTLGRVQTWVFGLPVVLGRAVSLGDVIPSVAMLLTVTLGSAVVLLRRVGAPMRA